MKRGIASLCFVVVAWVPFFAQAEQGSGFGSTHFVVGVPVAAVRSEAASVRLKKSLRCEGKNRINHALFCPDDDSRGLLLDLIVCEKKSLRIAAFLLTDEVIARAIIDAHKRGVKVDVVTDLLCCHEGRGKAHMLHKNGIPVVVYCGKCANKSAGHNRADIMHNKFIVFESNVDGRALVWTGSFNFTHSARLRNQENVLVLDEPSLVERYSKQFDVLKTRCQPFNASMILTKEQKNQSRQKNGTPKHSIDRDLVRVLGQA